MFHVFAAILMFTFFALGGLVVDLGFVRLAQRQMNTPTDSASLEGMRLQDTLPEPARRAAARDILRKHYDDDFESTPDDDHAYGAGPLVSTTGGSATLAANQQVVVDPAVVYKPDPEFNYPLNEPHGDMVAGYYDENDLEHGEDSSYLRSDFAVAPQNATDREAFLVRLRRTSGTNPLDEDPGSSSRGPVLPYLFARGSLIANELRTAGVTVRSTSVAAGRPVTQAGIPYPALDLVGTTPFLLEFDHWNTVAPNATFEITFAPFNVLAPGLPLPGTGVPAPVAVIDNRYDEERTAWSIGDSVQLDLQPDIDEMLERMGNPHETGYVPQTFIVPIYEGDIATAVVNGAGVPLPPFEPPISPLVRDLMSPRIVGFGMIEVILVEDTEPVVVAGITIVPANPRVVAVKLTSRVWPLNVSAVETPGLGGVDDDVAELIVDLNDLVDEGTRAAALVR